jgi:hypothetical protein
MNSQWFQDDGRGRMVIHLRRIVDKGPNQDRSEIKNNSEQGESSKRGASRRTPPREEIEFCLNKSANEKCDFLGRRGDKLSGKCQDIGSYLACVPNGHRP